MKLNEIKQIGQDVVNLQEGVIPVHVSMTLDQIINDGKITNSVQTFVLGGLIEMFKDGGPFKWPRELNAYGMSTLGASADMIDAVRSLSPQEQVQIAEWLQVQLADIAGYESNPGCSDALTFMRMQIQKQND